MYSNGYEAIETVIDLEQENILFVGSGEMYKTHDSQQSAVSYYFMYVCMCYINCIIVAEIAMFI